MQEHPPHMRAGVRGFAAILAVSEPLDGAGMVAGNARDIGAGDAQVIELTVVESIELTDGLLVGGPLAKRLAEVHLKSPFVYKGDIVLFPLGEQLGFAQTWHAICACLYFRAFIEI